MATQLKIQNSKFKILLTGSAGFIGFHTTQALLKQGHHVIGIDNLNDYYAVSLKQGCLEELQQFCQDNHCADRYQFIKMDIADRAAMAELFKNYQFDRVIHLAAQAGVRYSIENPHAYVNSNLVGFVNVLEGCRQQQTAHLVYASSSSVYGMNSKIPFLTEDRVDYPISLYAATKKSNELMAHTYSHLYNIPTTGLRFFTVYGPRGRPDMAYFSFTKKIINDQTIDVFNHGKMERDFTYIDDIVEGIIRVMDHPPQLNIQNSKLPPPRHRIKSTISAIINRSPLNGLSMLLSKRWVKRQKEIICPCSRVMCHERLPM